MTWAPKLLDSSMIPDLSFYFILHSKYGYLVLSDTEPRKVNLRPDYGHPPHGASIYGPPICGRNIDHRNRASDSQTHRG